jgi:hypothetical protein
MSAPAITDVEVVEQCKREIEASGLYWHVMPVELGRLEGVARRTASVVADLADIGRYRVTIRDARELLAQAELGLLDRVTQKLGPPPSRAPDDMTDAFTYAAKLFSSNGPTP